MRVRKSGVYFVTVSWSDTPKSRAAHGIIKNHVRALLRMLERKAQRNRWRYMVQGVLSDAAPPRKAPACFLTAAKGAPQGEGAPRLYMLLWADAGISAIGAVRAYMERHGGNKKAHGLQYARLMGNAISPSTIGNILETMRGAYECGGLRLTFARSSLSCKGKRFVSLMQEAAVFAVRTRAERQEKERENEKNG